MNFPIGTIIAWQNTAIPSGWAVCNGNNGTPNLVDKFIRGIDATGTLRATGGNATSHTHTTPSLAAGGAHTHPNTSVSASNAGGVTGTSGGSQTNDTQSHGHNTLQVTGITTSVTHTHTAPNTNASDRFPKHIKRVFIRRIS